MKREDIVLLAVFLAMIAAVVGLAFTLYSTKGGISGYATGTSIGSANLTVESAVEINFTNATINWGSGRVNTGKTYAILDSEGTVFQGNWTNQYAGLALENIGNINVTINLKTSKNAASFIGGTNPSYLWKITNLEPGSCNATSNATYGWNTYANVSTTNIMYCSPLQYLDDKDIIEIDVNLTIPYNSFTGVLSDIVTATATAL
jgi:hypothetical protein